MPSTSPAQHRFMEAVAHSPSFAKKAGVPQKVGEDFANADDKAGITKTHNGKPVRHEGASPKSPAEQMARRRGQGLTYREVAGEHGVAKSTAHRNVMRQGFSRIGSAK